MGWAQATNAEHKELQLGDSSARIPPSSQLCNAELQHRSLSFSWLCYLEGPTGKKYDSLWGEVCNARCVRSIRITWEAKVATALLISRPWSQGSQPSMISWVLMFLLQLPLPYQSTESRSLHVPSNIQANSQKKYLWELTSLNFPLFVFYFPRDLSLFPLWLVTL